MGQLNEEEASRLKMYEDEEAMAKAEREEHDERVRM